MHAKVFSIQIYIPIFPPNSAEGLHFSAFHFLGGYTCMYATVQYMGMSTHVCGCAVICMCWDASSKLNYWILVA